MLCCEEARSTAGAFLRRCEAGRSAPAAAEMRSTRRYAVQGGALGSTSCCNAAGGARQPTSRRLAAIGQGALATKRACGSGIKRRKEGEKLPTS
eukprot:3939102-Rhodomonas_salina.6